MFIVGGDMTSVYRERLKLRDIYCRTKKYLAKGVERSSFSNGADQAVVECNGVLDERSGLNRYQS